MRIISGSARGHRLKSVDGMLTRPTADRIKEAVFNMITPYIYDANVLDLFAGTGNLGIEALSRGARFAVFVDKDSTATNIISDNLVHTKLEKFAKIFTCDWLQYMNKIDNSDIKFDIIFLDPPYSKDYIQPVLQQISDRKLLKENGIIIVETDKGDLLPEIVGEIQMSRTREYGRTNITIYSK